MTIIVYCWLKLSQNAWVVLWNTATVTEVLIRGLQGNEITVLQDHTKEIMGFPSTISNGLYDSDVGISFLLQWTTSKWCGGSLNPSPVNYLKAMWVHLSSTISIELHDSDVGLSFHLQWTTSKRCGWSLNPPPMNHPNAMWVSLSSIISTELHDSDAGLSFCLQWTTSKWCGWSLNPLPMNYPKTMWVNLLSTISTKPYHSNVSLSSVFIEAYKSDVGVSFLLL